VTKLVRKDLADVKVPVVPVGHLEVVGVEAAAKFSSISLRTGELFWVARSVR
jgi:hypothetical protein